MNDRRRPERAPTRRRLLAGLGSAGVAGVAGCVGDDGTTGDDGTGDDDTGDDSGGAGDGTEPADDGDETDDGDASETDGSDESEPSDTGDESTWSAGGPPDREGWSVTFADRFEDGELDTSAWDYGAGMGPSCPGGSLECWERDHAWVDAETDRLVIQASDEPSGDRDYTAAGVTNRPALEQEFGYFEARTRPPAQPGGLPAFWMWWNAQDWSQRREIDVYEIYGDDALEAHHNVHVDCEPRDPGEGPSEWRGGRSTLDTAADEQFHVWGVEWAPESVTFYIDGEAVGTVEDDVVGECLAGEAMWVVLSTHVNEDMGDATAADYPYTHEIDWVRIWQHEDWA